MPPKSKAVATKTAASKAKPKASDKKTAAKSEVRIAVLESKNQNLSEKNDELKEQIRELKAAKAELKGENDKLKLQMKTIVQRVQQFKKTYAQKTREMQTEINQRMQDANVDRDTRVGILEYMKQGFGSMLGALGALLLVGTVADMLAGEEEDPAAGDDVVAEEEPAAEEEFDAAGAEDDGGFGDFGDFEFRVARARGGAAIARRSKRDPSARTGPAVVVEKAPAGKSTRAPRRGTPGTRTT